MSFAISLQNVTKKFNDFVAVDNLNLTVNRGDIYGFLGPNGSGKSTTLRMIMGLISPTTGNISLFGTALSENRSEIMRKVGCIIEKPDFYTYLTAHENLKLFARAHQLHYTESQYQDLYQLVGLYKREQGKVKTFSHGMKQRLGLAQALLHNPEMIILDEPNTGLDPQGIIDLRKLIMQLNAERGMTVLFSSHILTEVQEICNHMIVINKGKTIAQGNVQQLISSESLHVNLEVVDRPRALAFIQQSPWVSKLQQEINKTEQVIHFQMAKDEIPLLVQQLSAHNIDILSIDYRNQLEEYFLKITHS
ncbi:MAG: ABC transporter ATP-binding protein [Chitinophagaceae bacterium]|nr:ABC transporter ATP-binding protein [Chitinophagaceae bacterium]